MELLAPARDLDALKAAFDAGADAVYLGLKDFSARKRAKNFSFEELLTAEAIKRSLNKKIYIALNTLIFQNDIPNLIEIIAFLETLKVDALIIQDYGIYELLQTFNINIPLHASTQMGTKNHRQVNFLKKLGFKRAVLERQLTLKEIESIKKQTDMELEVFIHGAICYSLSGCCFFSKGFSDRSGNRGDCMQPCRFPFISKEGTNIHPFSTKDLNGLAVVSALYKLGITSVKIEGRMKGTDYIFPVVSAYRKVIDFAKKGLTISNKELDAILNELSYATLSRQGEKGFFFFDKKSNLLGNPSTGIAIGTVKNTTTTSLFFKTSFEIHVGDSIRIEDESGNIRLKLPVKAIYLQNQKVRLAEKGSYIGIPSNTALIKKGFLIYLVHRREGYKPKKTKTPPITIKDYKDRGIELKKLFNDYLSTLPRYTSLKVQSLAFSLEKHLYSIGKEVYYFIPPTVYESELYFYNNIAQSGVKGVISSHPSETLLNCDFTCIGSFFLYATNVFAIKFFERLGIEGLSISLELKKIEFDTIKNFFPFWISWRNVPLAISRIPVTPQVYRLQSLPHKGVEVKEKKDGFYLFKI